jgi:hypothetical protein
MRHSLGSGIEMRMIDARVQRVLVAVQRLV